MNDYGELLDSKTVRFERLLPGPIEKVWAYLVESEKRAQWLCGGETDPKVGGNIDMHFHNASLSSAEDIARPEKYKDMPEKMFFSGTVTRYEPPRALSHTWEFDNEASEVCYELEEVGDKIRLVLTHRRLHSSDIVLSVSGGWHTHLDILVDVLEQRKPRPFWKTQTEFAAEYAKRLGL
jgi:uncharacterized protein YndB with AHSA1/START domain